MRLILKLLAAPFALALTIAAAFFSLVLSVSNIIFGIASTLVFLGAAVLLISGETAGGIAFLAAAFLVSPAGLPALAGWLAGKLGGAGGALRSFIFS
jgi:hypothetical protein